MVILPCKNLKKFQHIRDINQVVNSLRCTKASILSWPYDLEGSYYRQLGVICRYEQMGYLVSISCPFLGGNKEEKITGGEGLVPLLMTLMHLNLFSAAGHDGHYI